MMMMIVLVLPCITAGRYGLKELKQVYGIKLASFLDHATALSIFSAGLNVEHEWLCVDAFRMTLKSMEYICGRSSRAIPLAIQLLDRFLQRVLLADSQAPAVIPLQI